MTHNVFVIYNIIVTVLYSIYLEFGPGLGGLIVHSVSGRNFFNILNIFNLVKLMFRPLWDINMWQYRYLDINWLFVMSVAIVLFYIVNKVIMGPERINILRPGASLFERMTSIF